MRSEAYLPFEGFGDVPAIGNCCENAIGTSESVSKSKAGLKMQNRKLGIIKVSGGVDGGTKYPTKVQFDQGNFVIRVQLRAEGDCPRHIPATRTRELPLTGGRFRPPGSWPRAATGDVLDEVGPVIRGVC